MITVGICRQCSYGGTLSDGLCAWCLPAPASRPTVVEAFAALADELHAEGVADPLAERLPLGLVWYDVCRLLGVEPPAAVLAFLDAPAVVTLPAAEVRRWLPIVAD